MTKTGDYLRLRLSLIGQYPAFIIIPPFAVAILAASVLLLGREMLGSEFLLAAALVAVANALLYIALPLVAAWCLFFSRPDISNESD